MQDANQLYLSVIFKVLPWWVTRFYAGDRPHYGEPVRMEAIAIM